MALDAFGYPHPSTLERRLAEGGLRLRARLVRRLPVRIEPRFARDLPNIRSYPHGYDVAQLGVFPRAAGKPAPVPTDKEPDARESQSRSAQQHDGHAVVSNLS